MEFEFYDTGMMSPWLFFGIWLLIGAVLLRDHRRKAKAVARRKPEWRDK